MGRVAGVFDNPPGFPCTPPGVDVLEGGKLTSNNVADRALLYMALSLRLLYSGNNQEFPVDHF